MKPNALRPGDTVAYVTPASPIAPERLDRLTELLANDGISVKLASHALNPEATDAERAADLQNAFDDPEIAGVFCTRGGYGCARLLRHLDLDRIAASGKMFLGFSDITTLHLALNRRGLPTIHGPMALTLHFVREPWVLESFRRVILGDVVIPAEAPPATSVVPGVAEGEVTGGCLCLLTDSIGTPNALDARGKILLIEDVDEAPHRIDAMLTHLLNAGVLDGVAGIMVGEMTRTDEKADESIGGRPWREIVRERLAPLGVPLAIDFPMGHAANMLTLPLGIGARLNATDGTLTYLESLCAT